VAEYTDPVYGSDGFYPTCDEFTNTGGTAHFSWSELNGHFLQGNPHSPWGLVSQALENRLEATRANYDRGGIRLTSGYRCPHGNYSIPDAVIQSRHTHGRAADMFSSDHAWTEEEFELLRSAAATTGPIELTQWTTYNDRHLHAAW
jgi:hypothetical protein